MTLARVPLCRNCGRPIFWNINHGIWMHRRGVMHCRAYKDTIAQPTVFAEMSGEQF